MHHLIYIMQIRSVIFLVPTRIELQRSPKQSGCGAPAAQGCRSCHCCGACPKHQQCFGAANWVCSSFWTWILLWSVPLRWSNPCSVSQESCTASRAPPRQRAWSPPLATSPSALLARWTPSASAAATPRSATDPGPRRGGVLLWCRGHTWQPLFCFLNLLCCFCTAKLQASCFGFFSPWHNVLLPPFFKDAAIIFCLFPNPCQQWGKFSSCVEKRGWYFCQLMSSVSRLNFQCALKNPSRIQNSCSFCITGNKSICVIPFVM